MEQDQCVTSDCRHKAGELTTLFAQQAKISLPWAGSADLLVDLSMQQTCK